MTIKVNGLLDISAWVECPHCNRTIDLFKIQSMNDDGVLAVALFEKGRFGTKDLDQEVDCPHCKKAFQVGEIEY
jgi:endogenous inhibitor of DNA gyrase (YacG/DUF329 family)